MSRFATSSLDSSFFGEFLKGQFLFGEAGTANDSPNPVFLPWAHLLAPPAEMGFALVVEPLEAVVAPPPWNFSSNQWSGTAPAPGVETLGTRTVPDKLQPPQLLPLVAPSLGPQPFQVVRAEPQVLLQEPRLQLPRPQYKREMHEPPLTLERLRLRRLGQMVAGVGERVPEKILQKKAEKK